MIRHQNTPQLRCQTVQIGGDTSERISEVARSKHDIEMHDHTVLIRALRARMSDAARETARRHTIEDYGGALAAATRRAKR